MKTLAGLIVYEIWDASASVPGGSILSRHETEAEAIAAMAAAEAREAERQSQPKQTLAAAKAHVRAHYQDYGRTQPFDDGAYDRGVVAEFARRRIHRARHAYEVRKIV